MPRVLAALLIVLLLLGSPFSYAIAADPLTTGVVGLPLSEGLKMIRGSLDKMLKDAEAKGDYLLNRSVQSAKDALDRWQEANAALLKECT